MNKCIVLLLSISSAVLLTQDGCNAAQRAYSVPESHKEMVKLSDNSEYTYPLKTAAYWTSPIMSKSDAHNLAKHDLLIVDLENKFNNPQILSELKKLNPAIKLLAYSNPMEIFLTIYSNRPWQNKVIKEITTNRQEWLLKTIKIEKGVKREDYAKFWPGMTMLNMSSTCPKIKGQRYSDWMANKIENEILSDPIFDGYFMDNGTVNISWVYPRNNEKIDINGDKKADSDIFVDRKWSKGVNSYLSHLRAHAGQKKGIFSWFVNLFVKKKDIIIISNKGDLNLLKMVDGKFFEKFPNNYLGDKWANGWRQSMSNAKKTGEFTILQTDRGNLQFGLASYLLLDNVYIAVGQDDAGVFPNFYLKTGKALSHMKTKNGVYTREYEKVTVTVKPINNIGQITLK